MDDQVSILIEQIKQESDFFAKAHLIDNLHKLHGVTIKKISEALGLKDSYVCHILRLNRIPPFVVDGYYSGSISLSHLFVISRLKDESQMSNLYERVLAENLTVAQTEEQVREILYGIKHDGGTGQRLTSEEKNQLIEILKRNNLKVKVVQTRVKSKVLLEAKGNLQDTTLALRKFLDLLTT